MKQELLLSRLLDKYEKSKHLMQPGISSRRVMLRIEKNEFPEYQYEDAQIRDAWNDVVKTLEAQDLISTQWVSGRPVLSCIVLNLEHLSECYRITGRKHPKEIVQSIATLVASQLSQVTTDWIAAWRDDVCSQAREAFRVPGWCKKDRSLLDKLLTAFAAYDSLHGEAITMRAFSNRCYQDTKTFEREVRDLFLRIAVQYSVDLAEACEQGNMGDREKLAYLGVYARPEFYELAGDCAIKTNLGELKIAAMSPYGLALPSTAVDSIASFDLSKIQKIVFIENKTNYDEFILSDLHSDELVVYHGGFLSPQKRKFFKKIAAFAPEKALVAFWADIDLGGFQMFERLQMIFPHLTPMRMSGDDVVAYHCSGLKRPAAYLEQVRAATDCGKYPRFRSAMEKILEYGVTIEQEVFLTK